jgi:hypothetical protein
MSKASQTLSIYDKIDAQRLAEVLYSSAVNNDTVRLEKLLRAGVNPNISFMRYNTTALHGATFSRHASAVEILLRYGADKNIRNKQGQTTIDINRSMGNNEIYDLLNPEQAEARDLRNRKIMDRQNSYATNHAACNTRTILEKVADEYRNNEKVTNIGSTSDALQYIQDAVYFITLDALEAEKYAKGSDDRWNIDSRIIRMIHVISASAHYMRKEHQGVTQRMSAIDWKSLARMVRVEQYHPFFISGISYDKRSALIREALHDITLKNELEDLRNSCRQLQQNIDTFKQDIPVIPRFSRLQGFFNDEYTAQYMEDAIKNWGQFGNISDEKGRARLLRSIMIVGEALNDASPILRGQFDTRLVNSIIAARIVLCHPESPENRATIALILRGQDVRQINRSSLPIAQLSHDIKSMYQSISRYLLCYEANNMSVQKIWQYIGNIPMALPVVNIAAPASNTAPVDSSVSRLAMRHKAQDRLAKIMGISPEYRSDRILDEIRDIKYFLIEEEASDKLALLQVEFKLWVAGNDPHKGKQKEQQLRSRLADPAGNVAAMKESIRVMEDFQRQVEQGRIPPTDKEKKQLATYPQLSAKCAKWEEYANAKSILDLEVALSKQQTNMERDNNHRIKTESLVSFCLEHAHKVSTAFGLLNNPRYVHNTAHGYTSRGFGSHPDHQVLEFYQIMVGSCARSLLENGRFMAIAPDRLKEILTSSAKPSRGYLAHNGTREEGKAFAESKDRAEVFYTNSKQIIEAMPMLHAVSHALKYNMNYDLARSHTHAVILHPAAARSM